MRIALLMAGLALVTIATGPGCPGPDDRGTPPGRAAAPEPVTGRWLAVRMERESRHIQRLEKVLVTLLKSPKGRLAGLITREGHLTADSGKRLACNRKRRARLTQSARILGRLRGTTASLRLTEPRTSGDCAQLFPLGATCTASAAGGHLSLRCGEQSSFRLRRLTLDGVWSWRTQSTSGGGDTQVLSERYHITQKGGRLSGFCDQILVSISSDEQRFQCNGRLKYTRQARHVIDGSVHGYEVRISFPRVLIRKGACEKGRPAPRPILAHWKPLEGRLEVQLPDGRVRNLIRY